MSIVLADFRGHQRQSDTDAPPRVKAGGCATRWARTRLLGTPSRASPWRGSRSARGAHGHRVLLRGPGLRRKIAPKVAKGGGEVRLKGGYVTEGHRRPGLQRSPSSRGERTSSRGLSLQLLLRHQQLRPAPDFAAHRTSRYMLAGREGTGNWARRRRIEIRIRQDVASRVSLGARWHF